MGHVAKCWTYGLLLARGVWKRAIWLSRVAQMAYVRGHIGLAWNCG